MSTLVVFARAPERGMVKSRLAATVGQDAALTLYEGFLEDSLAVAADAARRVSAQLVLAVAGPIDHPSLLRLSSKFDAIRAPQPDGDLGARMGSFIEAHRASGPVCIVGSDAPTLRSAQIERAFVALRTHELAIGPGIDGGYWLLGARRAITELLVDMPWSTDRLLGLTLDKLAGRRVALLDFFYDVDDGEDLALLRRHLAILPVEHAPATRRALARI